MRRTQRHADVQAVGVTHNAADECDRLVAGRWEVGYPASGATLPLRGTVGPAVGSGTMDDDQRKELLGIARAAVEDELLGRPHRSLPTMPSPGDSTGAFVTLRRGKLLRGCMGTFKPEGTLAETIDHVARLSGRDPRFTAQPVTIDDLREIKIEISVLGPLELTDEPTSLRIGVHGILIRRGEASGCFLPHVAIECGWTPEEFLSSCCSTKAGLAKDAWKEPGTDVYLFTAEVFGE